MTLVTLPADISSAFQMGNLIPVVGAGVSMSIRRTTGEPVFPSWKSLLILGKDELRKQGKEKLANLVEAQLEMNRYLDAAEGIKEGLTGSLWTDFIKKSFAISIADIDQSSLELANAIWQLGNQIITLNYDKILQLANPKPTDVCSIDNSQKAELATFSRRENLGPSIWHLHGRVDNVDSIVLTASSYEALYEEKEDFKGALTTLHTILQTRSLIFIGCSMDDADLLKRISTVAKIFNGNTRPHYVLTRRNEAQAISDKLRDLPISVIEFEDFGSPLISMLSSIAHPLQPRKITHEHGLPQVGSTSISPRTIHPESRIAVLIHNPLGKRNAYVDLRSEIDKLKCEKHFLPLNISTLQDLESFDALFIITEWTKDKILIEDESLSPYRVTLTELLDNVGVAKNCGIFIFGNHDLLTDQARKELATAVLPVAAIPKYDKSRLASIFFKVFRKKNISEDGIIYSNQPFCFPTFGSSPQNIEKRTPLPSGIDFSSVRDFVGRSTDIRNLLRMLTTAKSNDDVITLKGAGGSGKTALAKLCAVEFSQRGMFADGIHFVDCEFIANSDIFTKEVAQCFDLQYETDFLATLKKSVLGKQLLILDNVETLLYIPSASEVLSLISQLSDLITVLATSRDALDIPNEAIYEIRRLTSEEGTELFIKQLGDRKLTEADIKFIRERIVEDLLDNSPLAIKLITKTIPNGKDLAALERELRENIFSSSEIKDPFTSDSDKNVERKKSIFASINYSYLKLLEKERKVFELLSLFPDGVNIELFKRLSREAENSRTNSTVPGSGFMVTDILLKSLESKSMVQSSNGLVRLQSLLGKFADFKLQQRDSADLLRIYQNSFEYMFAFADILSSLKGGKADTARLYFDDHQKNFLRAVFTAKQIDVNPTQVCTYLTFLNSMLGSGARALEQTLSKVDFTFPDHPTEQLCVKILILNLEYYLGNFEYSIKGIHDLLPKEKYLELNPETYLGRYIGLTVANIYGIEGDVLDELVMQDVLQYDQSAYPDTLYRLGVLDPHIAEISRVEFFTLEAKLALGKLTSHEIDTYIRGRPPKHYLETLQVNYTRTKLMGTPLFPIDSLTPTNPYSIGIKLLMEAMVENDPQTANSNYRDAISSLEHVKYFLAEAHLLYAKFLKSISHTEFDAIWRSGLELARSYHFRYLQYCFEELRLPTGIIFNVDKYPLPIDRDYQKSISILSKRARQKIRQ